ELVEELALLHSSAAAERNIQLTTEVEPDLPAVLCDPNLTTRAASNLAENALRYTPEGGRVRIGAEREGGKVRFSVSDTGIGIGEDEKDGIFNRYSRGAGGQAFGKGSVGLGLAIVRQIVELHGSTIEVKSEAGKGSEFSFTLESE